MWWIHATNSCWVTASAKSLETDGLMVEEKKPTKHKKKKTKQGDCTLKWCQRNCSRLITVWIAAKFSY